MLQDSSNAQQTPANDLEFWRNLWGMEVLSKVKTFFGEHAKKLYQRSGTCFIEKSPCLPSVRIVECAMKIVHMLFFIVLTCKWLGARILNGVG